MTLPLFDMHCHLEGTATPALVAELADRNGMTLPEGLVGTNGLFAWTGFVDFLKTYDLASSCIRSGEDYTRVTREYLAQCAAEGAIYAEFFLSPDHAAMAGLDYETQLEAVMRGIEQVEKECGIVGRIVITCIRHLGPKQALEVARLAAAQAHPLVVGFGMAGDENCHSAADFAPAFALADNAGLACCAHAGEAAGPDSVLDVINHLPVTRIGHGVRSIEAAAVVEKLVQRDIVLEVCVGSNLAIGIYHEVAEHPLPRLLDQGVKIVLGSDDPPYFATSIGEEYRRLTRDFQLPDAVLTAINQTAVDAAFCDEPTRQRLRQQLAQ